MKGNCHVGKVTEKQICVNVKLAKNTSDWSKAAKSKCVLMTTVKEYLNKISFMSRKCEFYNILFSNISKVHNNEKTSWNFNAPKFIKQQDIKIPHLILKNK